MSGITTTSPSSSGQNITVSQIANEIAPTLARLVVEFLDAKVSQEHAAERASNWLSSHTRVTGRFSMPLEPCSTRSLATSPCRATGMCASCTAANIRSKIRLNVPLLSTTSRQRRAWCHLPTKSPRKLQKPILQAQLWCCASKFAPQATDSWTCATS